MRGYSENVGIQETMGSDDDVDLDECVMLGDILSAKVQIDAGLVAFCIFKVKSIKDKDSGKFETVIGGISVGKKVFTGGSFRRQSNRWHISGEESFYWGSFRRQSNRWHISGEESFYWGSFRRQSNRWHISGEESFYWGKSVVLEGKVIGGISVGKKVFTGVVLEGKVIGGISVGKKVFTGVVLEGKVIGGISVGKKVFTGVVLEGKVIGGISVGKKVFTGVVLEGKVMGNDLTLEVSKRTREEITVDGTFAIYCKIQNMLLSLSEASSLFGLLPLYEANSKT